MINNNLSIDVIDDILDRFDNTKKVIRRFLDKNFNILECGSLFDSYNDLIFFKNNFLLSYSLDTFIEFQENFIINYKKQLKTLINEETISLETYYENEENIYEILIFVKENNKKHYIFKVNPFLNIYTALDNIYKKNLEIKISECEERLKILKESEKILEKSSTNVYNLSESPLQVLDMTFRKKKYKENIKNKIIENSNYILECNRELTELKLLDEEIDLELIKVNNIKDRLLYIFDTKFKFINTENKMIENMYVKNTSIEDEIEFFE